MPIFCLAVPFKSRLSFFLAAQLIVGCGNLNLNPSATNAGSETVAPSISQPCEDSENGCAPMLRALAASNNSPSPTPVASPVPTPVPTFVPDFPEPSPSPQDSCGVGDGISPASARPLPILSLNNFINSIPVLSNGHAVKVAPDILNSAMIAMYIRGTDQNDGVTLSVVNSKVRVVFNNKAQDYDGNIARVYLSLGNGTNKLTAGNFAHPIVAWAGITSTNTLTGGRGDDILIGSSGRDLLSGGAAGNDILIGGGGKGDSLAGSSGSLKTQESDLIIAGVIDANLEYLLQVLIPWRNGGTLQTRYSLVAPLLLPIVKTSSGDAQASGRGDNDWFIHSAGTVINDAVVGDIKTLLLQ